jgi:hypothetical protein
MQRRREAPARGSCARSQARAATDVEQFSRECDTECRPRAAAGGALEINGIAHVMLTVRSLPASKPFYKALLAHMGLAEVVDSDDYLYDVGARTAVGLRPAAREHADARFEQGRCGLHHVCFRARSRADDPRSLVGSAGAEDGV